MTMTRTVLWCVLGLSSAVIVLLDLLSHPYIQFPIMFILPVGLGAWYLGRGAGIFFATALVACRLGTAITLDQAVIPVWAAAVNAGIRMVVLIGLAVLAAAARERQTLARRVQLLEGILPICMFCKKIHQPDGGWEPIEAYVSRHSAAEFSHGLCEACAREHYEKYLPPPGSTGSRPSAVPDRGGC